MDKMFAKPFICGMAGHRDSVQTMSKHPTNLSTLASGGCDGEIRLWNLPLQKCIRSMTAHSGFVRGIAFSNDGNHLFSVGNDKTIKQWNVPNEVLVSWIRRVMSLRHFAQFEWPFVPCLLVHLLLLQLVPISGQMNYFGKL